MSKTFLLFLALISSLSAFTLLQTQKTTALQAIPWPFTICGNGDWTVEKLTLGSQPVRNTNNDIDAIGTATADTEFQTVDLVVKLNGVFLHSESIDFKKSYNEGDTVEFKYTNFIVGFAPPGTYGLTFTFKNNGKDNGCFGFSFKL